MQKKPTNNKTFSVTQEHAELDQILANLNSGEKTDLGELPEYNDPEVHGIRRMLLTPQQKAALNSEVELDQVEGKLLKIMENSEEGNSQRNFLNETERMVKPFKGFNPELDKDLNYFLIRKELALNPSLQTPTISSKEDEQADLDAILAKLKQNT